MSRAGFIRLPRMFCQLPSAGCFTHNTSVQLSRTKAFGQRTSSPYVATRCSSADTSTLESPLQYLEAKLGRFSDLPTVPPAKPLVIVISGPSGVGKDAVIKRLQELRPDLYFVVTATSRPMRAGEVDGVDYFFVSKSQFEEWIRSGELLEHALVYGEYKGIPQAQVTAALERGTDVVLRLDVQGSATVRSLLPEAVSIFLVASSEEELVRRLVDRKTEPLDRMLVRVATARKETNCMHNFDYVVVNEDGQLDATVQKITAIIEAEKCRVKNTVEASML